MKNIYRALWALLLLAAGSWFLADALWPRPFEYFAFRSAAIQLTGVVAMAAMSFAMVLAVRPRWADKLLNGLDKMYRLHKWLGITALVAAVAHWWLAQGTKWMVGWGWLTRPARGPREPITDPLRAWFDGQRHLAEDVGEWAFYAAVAFIAVALLKRIPYHWFAKTHRWMVVPYLVLVFHAAVLLKWDYWTQPVGWLTAGLMLAGTVAGAWLLSGRVGRSRTVAGEVADVRYFEPLRATLTTLSLAPGWPGHAAGQFAFVTSDPREGAHPYTIASAWNAADRQIRFVTKALGDHTRALHQTLRPGLPVQVEGALWLLHLRRQRGAADLGGRRHRHHALHRAHAPAGPGHARCARHAARARHPVSHHARRRPAGAGAAGGRRRRRRYRPARAGRRARRPADRRPPARGRARMARRQRVVLRSRRVWPGFAARHGRPRPAAGPLAPRAVPDALSWVAI